eukprot:203853-Rhodomonas_salina.1
MSASGHLRSCTSFSIAWNFVVNFRIMLLIRSTHMKWSNSSVSERESLGGSRRRRQGRLCCAGEEGAGSHVERADTHGGIKNRQQRTKRVQRDHILSAPRVQQLKYDTIWSETPSFFLSHTVYCIHRSH